MLDTPQAAEDVDLPDSENIGDMVEKARAEKERLEKHEDNLRQMNEICRDNIAKVRTLASVEPCLQRGSLQTEDHRDAPYLPTTLPA